MLWWVAAFLVYAVSVVLVCVFTKRKYSIVNLNEINSLLSEILETNFRNNSLSNAAQSILIVLKRFYNMDYATILIYKEDTNYLDVIASNSNNTFLKSIERYCNETFNSLGRSSARVLTSESGVLDYDSAKQREVCFSNFTMLKHQGKIIGAILLENKNAEPFSDDNTRYQLYDKVFKSTALVLQSVLYTENLISMTSTDQLTGVYNRRFIDMTLGEQLNIHQNLGLSFSVALFDIDHFKKFNDTYGHAFGDLVLKEVAAFMKMHLGENSWIARYGGEEFVLFFGRSDPKQVRLKVESLREGLSQLQLTDGNTVTSVTASFGISTFPSNGTIVNDLIERADTALYESKKSGRNRVTVFKK